MLEMWIIVIINSIYSVKTISAYLPRNFYYAAGQNDALQKNCIGK